MSTSWYRPGFVPKLVRKWTSINNMQGNGKMINRSVEVWEATCIVTNFSAITSPTVNNNNNNNEHEDVASPSPYCRVLINPANPNLSGVSKFPYFPKGGPEPESLPSKDSHPIMGYVTQWGGMEVGNGMMFAANVVDGLVHQLGGKELAMECQNLLKKINSVTNGVVQEGTAWITGPGNDKLKEQYSYLCHTIPPFYNINNNNNDNNNNIDTPDNKISHNVDILELCYINSLDVIRNQIMLPSQDRNDDDDDIQQPTAKTNPVLHIACPLLGAGCRGFPEDIAIQVAANASTRFLSYNDSEDASTQLPKTTTLTSSSSSTSSETPELQLSMVLAFVIPNGDIRHRLIKEIDQTINSNSSSSSSAAVSVTSQ